MKNAARTQRSELPYCQALNRKVLPSPEDVFKRRLTSAKAQVLGTWTASSNNFRKTGVSHVLARNSVSSPVLAEFTLQSQHARAAEAKKQVVKLQTETRLQYSYINDLIHLRRFTYTIEPFPSLPLSSPRSSCLSCLPMVRE